MNNSFGQNSMDTYSVPLEEHTTKLGKIFKMKERANPEKPGRTLSVMWDLRNPLIPDFVNRYSYLVRFAKPRGKAGNHYHQKKHELYFAVRGDFTVILENTTTKEREEITLREGDNQFLYVKPPIAHLVISKSEDGALLVMASAPEVTTDEYHYNIV